MTSPEEIQTILAMSREELIQKIVSTGFVERLPPAQQGIYLFGKTTGIEKQRGRAVCLAWGETMAECRITEEVLTAAEREIGKAGLKIPFLFFGRFATIGCKDVFWLFQIPWIFLANWGIPRTFKRMVSHDHFRVAQWIEEEEAG